MLRRGRDARRGEGWKTLERDGRRDVRREVGFKTVVEGMHVERWDGRP